MPFQRKNPKTPPTAKAAQNLTLNAAKRKLMDLVASRDHSEKELRTKLQALADECTVEETLQWAQKQNWLASSEKLKENWVEKLSRKSKGVRQINQKLEALGLESIKADPEDELNKARRLALTKWSADDFQGLSLHEAQKLKAQIMRYLAARGYESNVIHQILRNDFKYSSVSEEEIYDEEF